MEQNKAEMRQILFDEFKGLADFCSFGQANYHRKLDAVVERLSELQPVNPDKIAKDAIAFTLRFIENSLCDQMSNGIFNDFKNQQL